MLKINNMKTSPVLPKPKKRKINIKNFSSLAERVKKYMKEELEYFEKKNENNQGSGTIINSY